MAFQEAISYVACQNQFIITKSKENKKVLKMDIGFKLVLTSVVKINHEILRGIPLFLN